MQRKPNSVFDQVVKFLNSRPVGTIFTNEDLYSQVSEAQTSHKIRYKDYSYTTRFYRYWLMKAGCVEKLGDKKWKVLAHIPDHVSSDMVWGVKGRTPYQLWHISMEQNKPQEITIYEITKNNLVLPLVVGVNRVAPLLSTGSFFENEYDAAYFLSVGTGVPVEDIIKKSHNFINMKDEVEEQKEEEENENWEFELLDKLHEAIPTNEDESISMDIPFRWIYKINECEELVSKRRAHIFEGTTFFESDDLSSLIKHMAGSKMPWNCLADEYIEKFVLEQTTKPNPLLQNAAKEYQRRISINTQPEVKEQKNEVFPKSLLMEDIRGKEVFFMKDGRPSKGTVTSFHIICLKDKTPIYSHIDVDTVSTHLFSIDSLSFSKEDFKKKLAETVDSL